jgi:hypothetical protein
MFFLQDLIEKGEKQPNITIGVIVSIVVVILTVFFRILFGGKKQRYVLCISLHFHISENLFIWLETFVNILFTCNLQASVSETESWSWSCTCRDLHQSRGK